MSLMSHLAQVHQITREEMVNTLKRGGIAAFISSLDTETLQKLEALASQELFDRHVEEAEVCSTCKGSGRSTNPSQDFTCGDCRGSGKDI